MERKGSEQQMKRQLLNSERGSVMLEYVIMLGVAVPFLVFWLTLYEPGVGYTETGLAFVNFFRRIMVGISMPLP